MFLPKKYLFERKIDVTNGEASGKYVSLVVSKYMASAMLLFCESKILIVKAGMLPSTKPSSITSNLKSILFNPYSTSSLMG